MARTVDYSFYIAHKEKIDSMVEEQTNGEARAYNCGDLIVFFVRKDYCVFCRHCTDVFWDATHGPYMCMCELKKEQPCDCFEDCED